jgi:DNA polymerase I
MTPSADAVHLIDGTALLFRAYFSPRLRMTAPDGTPVGGVLGMTQAIARYVTERRARRVAVVFDAGQRTFRNRIDPTYKANRGDPPDDLVPQFDLARAAVRALGLRDLSVPDYEADDLLATLVARLAPTDRVLVSGDKDLIQLLGPGVWIADDRDPTLMDADAAVAKHGVAPHLWTSYQAMCGDAVDNVPGVPGVGSKTAAALVGALGDLSSIYARLDDVAGLPIRGAKGLADKLVAHREAAERSLRLVTLHPAVPDPSLTLSADDLAYRGPEANAQAVFDRLGFHQPVRRLAAYAGSSG